MKFIDPSKAITIPAGRRKDARINLQSNAPKHANRRWRDRRSEWTDEPIGKDALSDAIAAAKKFARGDDDV